MKFERDKWCLNRRGDRVRVVCVACAGANPIVGCIEGGGVATYAADGRFDPNRESSYDLVAPAPEPVRGYVVVAGDGTPFNKVFRELAQAADFVGPSAWRILDLSTAEEVGDDQ